MANKIFLAFANNLENPLDTLRDEDDTLRAILSEREQKNHYKVFLNSHIKYRRVGRYIRRHKKEIIIFHYSGHANRDKLFLEDKPILAREIADKLAECPNLKLIILNGCSTYGQVEQLMKLKTKPAIIATSAPVDDKVATLFSIAFYRHFCQLEYTVLESFNAAIAQETLTKKKIPIYRGILRKQKKVNKKETVWGIFPASGNRVNWKLPYENIVAQSEEFVPNTHLVPELLESFAPFDQSAMTVFQHVKTAEEIDKVKAILKPLALPLSEHLRKLLSPAQPTSNHQFFDENSLSRLQQISFTYNINMELVTFILIAELWGFYSRNSDIIFHEAELSTLKNFLRLSKEKRNTYCFPILIQNLLQLLISKKANLFTSELFQLLPLNESTNELGTAVAYLERIKNEPIDPFDENKINYRCETGEEELTTLLSHLAFLTNYRIQSIKSIHVASSKRSTKPKFVHHVVDLVQNFVNDLSVKSIDKDEYMHSKSVYLLSDDKEGSLNLSPFVIDANAFGRIPELAMLHFFDTYERDQKRFLYKHVYKPTAKKLDLNRIEYADIKDQFDTLTKLLFNTTLHSL